MERRITPVLASAPMRNFASLTLALCFACSPPPPSPEPATTDEPDAIDERSYQLGVIGAFAEVVGVGVKTLALSSAMSPEDMDALIDEAQVIVARNNASCTLETDFLVTDLFGEEVTAGKHVLFIYTGSTWDEYQALKAQKKELVDTDAYEGEARKDIARGMGRLLSYPEERIEAMLSESE